MDPFEAVKHDIQQGTSRKRLARFHEILVDCAKEIKSNDDAFKISTYPQVSSELEELNKMYRSTMSSLKASEERVIKNLIKIGNMRSSEYIDLALVKEEFQEADNSINDEADAPDLNALIQNLPSDGDDVVLAEGSINKLIPRDPITKKLIQEAVRSRLCFHTYEKSSIEAYMEQKSKTRSAGRVKCPVAGCAVTSMRKNDLEPDDEMSKIIGHRKQ